MPPEPPRPWRLSSRLVVLSGDRLLALRAADPAEPEPRLLAGERVETGFTVWS